MGPRTGGGLRVRCNRKMHEVNWPPQPDDREAWELLRCHLLATAEDIFWLKRSVVALERSEFFGQPSSPQMLGKVCDPYACTKDAQGNEVSPQDNTDAPPDMNNSCADDGTNGMCEE